MRAFLKYIPLIFSGLILIGRTVFTSNVNFNDAGVLDFLLLSVGATSFIVLATVHIIAFFTKQQLSLLITTLVFFLTLAIEIFALFISPQLTSALIDLLQLNLRDGLDDSIFSKYYLFVESVVAGILYFLAGYWIYFTIPKRNLKASLIFGILRGIAVPIVIFLWFSRAI